MNLYILRHGLAVEAEISGLHKDSERPLTPKGERKLWKIGEAMQEMGLDFDWILTSPYLRARQTAEIIADALGAKKKMDLTEHLTPPGSATKLIDSINRRKPAPEHVLLVGHEPYLSALISMLLTGTGDLRLTMKKAGLCKLSIEELELGRCATLEWLLTPKQLCLMA